MQSDFSDILIYLYEDICTVQCILHCNYKTPSRMIQYNFCNLQKFKVMTTQMVALTRDLVQK